MAVHRYHPPDPDCPFCAAEIGTRSAGTSQKPAFLRVVKTIRANTILALVFTAASAVKFAYE